MINRSLTLCALLVCFALNVFPSRGATTLISTGAVWKYLDNGTDQGTAWRGAGFDDSGWASGPAQLGYGEGDETTVVSFGPDPSNKYITTYFRRKIVVTGGITDATLRLLRDDGAVVYVNGVEVRRDNMPSGPIAFNTVATLTIGGADETTFFETPLPASAFVAGTNVIAVEVHQVNSPSSDLSFALELIANVGPPGPLVTVTAIDSQAREISPELDIPEDPAVFRLRRSGATNNLLTVGIRMSGTASNGLDYHFVSNSVSFPAGSASTDVLIEVIDDSLAEGTESVTLTVLPTPCPECYVVNTNSTATAYILDDEATNSPPTVAIFAPQEGVTLIAPADIELRATARDTEDNYTIAVDFFQGATRIGPAVFVPSLCPSPYCPYWGLIWSNVPPGGYTLTARATDSKGATTVSAPVHVSVVQSNPPPVTNMTFIPAGAVWRYNDRGTDLGMGWREPAYNDGDWASGSAQLGYGDGDETTVVSFGPDGFNKYITTYFRRAFEAGDANSVSNLMLRVLRDDGVVVYLNGVEVYRNNMPAGEVLNSTLAASVAADENAYLSAAISAGPLITGRNVLAAEIHQANVTSSDIGFDLELTGGSGPRPQELPVVNVAASDSDAAESGLLAVVFPGTFTFTRNGDLSNQLTVLFALSGSAQNGVDYIRLTNRVTFPAGSAEFRLNVAPLSDNLVEGTETVVLTLESPVCATVMPPPPGCYRVGSLSSATIFIADAPSDTNQPPIISIVTPTNGAAFTAATTIFMIASVHDADGSAPNASVEFFANNQSLGMGQLFDPGPEHDAPFRFLWSNPPPGTYTLTAKVTDDRGAIGYSSPVHITVNPPVSTNHAPYVQLNAPLNGDVFTAPANIVLQAYAQDMEDSYDLSVEFFAGANDLGPGVFVPTRCATPYCPYFTLTWSNVPPGSYTLTARVTDKSGASSNSAPVNIFIQGQPPGDRELHAIGVHSGGGASQNPGQASVVVNRPGKYVTLFLSSYQPVLWHINTASNTFIERVILGGYYRQTADGLAPNVEIINAFYDQDHRPYAYFSIGSSIDSSEFYQTLQRLCTLFGMDMASFQGASTAPYPTPFTIAAVQNDPRLRCSYPQPVDPAQLPNLSFALSFYDTSGAGNVFSRNYTLAGPQDGGRLLPRMRVVADAGGRYYYGTEWQSVYKVDSQAGTAQEMQLPPLLAEQGWPMGVAFDSQRQRVVVVSLGGEGYLYGYAPAQDQWSLISSMNNLDLDCLVHHPPGDALYGVEVTHSSAPVIYRLGANGARQGEIQLPVFPFDIAPGQYESELVSVGDYLVLLIQPVYVSSQPPSESRMYLIDPRSGEVRLTYRRLTTPENQRPLVRLSSPTEGALLPVGVNRLTAEASDPDGFVERVEFFINGASVGLGRQSSTNSNVFVFDWNNSQPGWFTLTVRATDAQGGTGTSPVVRVAVGTNDPDPEFPDLGFRLAFNDPAAAGGVFFRNYTLNGAGGDVRLLPATRVVPDAGGRYYYGAHWQEVWSVDSHTGVIRDLELPPDLPELSWPMGVAFDSARNRILLVTLGGEGFLYGYAPTSAQWSVVSSMNNHDLDNLVYHAPNDSLYGLEPGYTEAPVLQRFDANGQLVGALQLPPGLPHISPGGYASELVSVGDYLVLLIEPDYGSSYAGDTRESRIYLIDPRTGQVRLTYRHVGIPPEPHPQVTIISPSDGAKFTAGANIVFTANVVVEPPAVDDDFDGDYTSVEFFANGESIGVGNGSGEIFGLQWWNAPAGNFSITAKVIDFRGLVTVSAPVHIIILESDTFTCPIPIQWQNSAGGRGYDRFHQALQTPDGGYICGGQNFGELGDFDYWAVRFNAAGVKQWEKRYGGGDNDEMYDLQLTHDGGYILAGGSSSITSSTKTAPNIGEYDFWVVRLDSNGDVLWDRTYGGTDHDFGRSVQQTADGGFIVVGESSSEPSGNKTSPHYGDYDVWLVRLDANGNKLWDRTYGGTGMEFWSHVRQTHDGGFVLCTGTSSGIGGNKSTPGFGANDAWIVRTDSEGNKLWDKTYGGTADEVLTGIIETADGGFVASGSSGSPPSGNKSSPQIGGGDAWVLALNADGSKRWDKSFGGTAYEYFVALDQTADGGFITGGYSFSGAEGNKRSPTPGGWLVHLDTHGEMLWDRTVTSNSFDSVHQTSDGGFVLAGDAWNPDTSTDGWLLKLGPATDCDMDHDGVPDSRDACPGTLAGEIVNSHGCSMAQLCSCDRDWDSHAAYVRCVIEHSWEFYRQGRITADQRQGIEYEAVMSDCGARAGETEPVCLHLLPLTLQECQQEGIQFVLSGDYSGGCVVETSSDMVHWTPVETGQVTITGLEVACPPAHISPSRFYRVRLTP